MTLKHRLGYVQHYLTTTQHKAWVVYYMNNLMRSHHVKPVWKEPFDDPDFRADWIRRAKQHDRSKFRRVEADGFATTIFDMKNIVYRSAEYNAVMERIRPSIDAHYLVNDHHPEHFVNGIHGMPTIAKMEMVCDWAAAVRRGKGGDIAISIVKNGERFGYGRSECRRLVQWAILAKAVKA